MERFVAPVFSIVFVTVLLAVMQLQHDSERIDQDTVLLTNHWAGEVRRCHRSRNSELSCRPTTLEPRPWYLALSPFDSPAERVAKRADKPAQSIDLFVNLVFYGGFGLAIVMIFAGPVWDSFKERKHSSRADGGSVAHGDAGSGDGGDSGGDGAAAVVAAENDCTAPVIETTFSMSFRGPGGRSPAMFCR